MKKNNIKIIFVTGTDTGVGKTTVTCKMIEDYISKGYNVAALKPIASGCDYQGNRFGEKELVNDDALKLFNIIKKSNKKYNLDLDLDLDWINPIKFEPPIAPHIAADIDKRELSVDIIMDYIWPRVESWLNCCYKFENNILFIEGAGGWQVPLNNSQNYSDWVKLFQDKLSIEYGDVDFSVILVVAMKLGCLNHAILSFDSIRNSGCNFSGFYANVFDDKMLNLYDNIKCLQDKIKNHLGNLALNSDSMELI